MSGAPGSEQAPAGSGSRELLPAAVALGLGAALGEVAILGVRRLALGHAIHLGPDIIWMAPVAEVTLFVVVAAGLVVLRAATGGRLPRFWVYLPLTTLLGLSLVLVSPWLHRIAGAVLALGIGVQLARMLERDSARRAVPRAALLLGAVALVLGAGSVGWRRWQESARLGRLAAARDGAPNVLLLVYDTMRAKSLGLYGRQRNTSPELERLAAEGVTFDRAFSTAPWTLPSHASIFTGRWPHELSVGWFTGLDARYPTLAEIFAQRGYSTAGFVANTVYASYEYGLNRGFARYEDYPVTPGQLVLSSAVGRAVSNSMRFRRLTGATDIFGRKNAADIVDDFLAWADRPGPRPFFAFLNFFDVHEPYRPPAPWDTLFGPVASGRLTGLHFRTNSAERSQKWKMDSVEVQTELDAYESAAAYLDHELGRLVAQLDERGLMDNTIIVVTSDHGEEFGERRVFGHGTSLNLDAVHVPLVLRYPARVPAKRRLPNPVSLRDLGATLLQLAGAEPGEFPGHSLAGAWDSTATRLQEPLFTELQAITGSPDWYPAARANMVSVIDGGWRYITNARGQEELYDWANDPAETRNRSAAAEDADRLARLRAAARATPYLSETGPQ